MGVMIVPILILIFYAVIIIGSIGLVIWAITSRIKEKKIEKDKLDEYKKY
ncbi:MULTISPECIES: hypothetical protein [unclassified Clostridium]|nr:MULTISPECIES: hypothetical protein [unclassified Clostridium]MBP3916551.1 hypothetical protein [Clostridium sp.]MEE0933286.1 hypothetical protein [Clostridium sp.]